MSIQFIDRRCTISVDQTCRGYTFKYEGKIQRCLTREKIHQFFLNHSLIDTVKLCFKNTSYYLHFTLDEPEKFASKEALRRILSQETDGAWIEEKNGKQKYFVDNGWVFSKIEEVSKEQFFSKQGSSLGQKIASIVSLLALGVLTLGSKIQHRGKPVTSVGLLSRVILFPMKTQAQQPIDGEFRVNIDTQNSQANARTARLENGGFVVVWQGGQTGNIDIYVQIYNATGAPTMSEFRCNTNTADDQQNPAVAGLEGGGFVVVWQGLQTGNNDIYAQIYNTTGRPVSSELRCNTEVMGSQSNPAVTKLEGGGFVVVWDGDQTGNNDIYAQIYNATGEPNIPELRCNINTSGSQYNPAVAGLKGGGFVVVWEGNQAGSTDIYRQIYNAVVGPTSSEMLCNTDLTGVQYNPAVARLEGGGFVVVWQGSQTGNNDIYAQIYNATDGPISSELLCNRVVAGSQGAPSVAGLVDGNFVVVWRSDQTGNDDVYAQIFNTSGGHTNNELRCNTNLNGSQDSPAVTELLGGGLVVVWRGDQTGNSDIYAQRYYISPVLIPTTAQASFTSSPTPFPTSFQSTTDAQSSSSITPTPSPTSLMISSLSSAGPVTTADTQPLPIPAPAFFTSSPSTSITTLQPTTDAQISSPMVIPTSFPTSILILSSSQPSSQQIMSSTSSSSSPQESSWQTIAAAIGGSVGAFVIISGVGVFLAKKYGCAKDTKVDDSNTSQGDVELQEQNPETAFPSRQVSSFESKSEIFSDYLSPSDKLDRFDPMPEVLKQPNPTATFKVEDFPSVAEVAFIPMESEPLISTKIGSKEGNRYVLLEQVDPEKQLALRKTTGVTLKFDDNNVAYIGAGTHAVVKIAQQSKTRAYVAAKEIRNTPQVPNAIRISAHEGEILKQLQGVANIIQLYDEYYIKNKETLYQFMCLAGFGDGSTLAQKLSGQTKRIRSAILVEVTKELLKGAIGMQERHIYHFDLKPSNFVFDMKGTLYIADFGSAKELEQGMLKEYVYADAYYFSPERIELSKTEYNNRTTGVKQKIKPISAEKSESWSLGVSLLEMIKGYNCFEGNDPVLERNENFFEEITEQELQDVDAPDVIADIIRSFLKINPNERISTLEAYERIKEISSFKSAEEKMNTFAQMKGLKVDLKHTGQQ
jgi:hypothetical protein